MHTDRKISLAKRITNFSTLVVILSLVTITSARAPAHPLLSSTQLDSKVPIRSRTFQIVASISAGETRQNILQISLKNISHKEIRFRETDVLNDYLLYVKDREGNLLTPSEKGKRTMLESRMLSLKPPVILRPGEEVIKRLTITDIYDLKPGGVYTITVYRRMSLDKGKTLEEARSNIIRTKIT